jgi:hypothetical protein|tara:strand:- start:803 stop:985 length:183 start_codon:yes stop_codon:yes gene_type:complete
MPMVNGKKYSYTKAGKKAAKKARMKKYGGGNAGAKKSISSMRMAYKKGGKAEVMPKAKPC